MPGQPDVMRLFLHIGMNKTGTTALQAFWARNAEGLRRRGFLYPETGREEQMQHLGLAEALGFEGARAPQDNKLSDLRERLDREVRAAAPEVVLLSSEFLSRRRDLRPVRRFLCGYDVRVVVYLRRHDSWMYARYSQALRSVSNPPWDKGLEGFCTFTRARSDLHASFGNLVDAWSAAFGADRIVVRPYERQQNRPDLLTDISTAIGMPAPEIGFERRDDPQNASFGALANRLAEEVQRSALSLGAKRAAVRGLAWADRRLPTGLRRAPPRSRRLLIGLVEENLADYRYIAVRYLGREDGRLFLDPLPRATWEPG